MKTLHTSVSFASKYVDDGIVSGKLRLTLQRVDGAVAQDINGVAVPAIDVDGSTADFTQLANGIYVVSALRLDSNGAPVGDAKNSDPVEITQATVDVPASVSVSIA
jgi:uncharacterized protein HemX